MPIIDVSVVPLGTRTTSLSRYVRAMQEVLRRSGLRRRLTPMSTCLEGDWDDVFAAVRELHETCFRLGCGRVATTIRIDDRRDRPHSMRYKLDRARGRRGPVRESPGRGRRAQAARPSPSRAAGTS
jgi:uncharacterized protein (TIGR00106 family)